MHVAIAVLTIIASLRWGRWSTWREYHAGMLFMATGGLLYEYIVQDYSLWKFHPDLLYGHGMTVIVYALVTMPVSIFLFLSHFPEEWGKRVRYILFWSGMYITVEWILYISGRITYDHGWKFFYSFLFDIVMFSMIAWHQYYPVRAYIASLCVTAFLIMYFDVPFRLFK